MAPPRTQGLRFFFLSAADVEGFEGFAWAPFFGGVDGFFVLTLAVPLMGEAEATNWSEASARAGKRGFTGSGADLVGSTGFAGSGAAAASRAAAGSFANSRYATRMQA